MELTGKIVKHGVFGVGTIIEHADNYVKVEFTSKTSKFIYPDAFEKFIKAEDAEVQAAIIKEINDAKAAAQQKRLAEEAARKATEEHRVAATISAVASKRGLIVVVCSPE